MGQRGPDQMEGSEEIDVHLLPEQLRIYLADVPHRDVRPRGGDRSVDATVKFRSRIDEILDGGGIGDVHLADRDLRAGSLDGRGDLRGGRLVAGRT